MKIIDLLKEPELKLELLCGRSSADRPISRTYCTQNLDPTPWLEGNELVLVKSLSELTGSRTQAEFIRALDAKTVTAVVIPRESYRHSEHAALVAACDTAGLPLLMTDVTLFQKLVDRVEASSLPVSTEVNPITALLTASSSGLGITGVLEVFTDSIPGTVAVMLGPHDERVASAQRNPAVWSDAIVVSEMFSRDGEGESYSHAGRDWRVASIQAADRLEGYLIASPAPGREDEFDHIFPVAVACLQLETMKATPARIMRRSRFGTLLENARQAPQTANVLRASLEDLGISATEGIVILAVSAGGVGGAGSEDLSRLCDVVEDALSEFEPPLATIVDGCVVGLIRDADPSLHRIASLIRRAGFKLATLGVSYVRFNVAQLSDAVDEAAAASKNQSPLQPMQLHEAGLEALGAYLRKFYFSTSFTHSVLSGLLDYDASQEGELIKTLIAYFAHDFNPGAAAASLFIHRHTLTYRLKQIQSITGLDPRSSVGSLKLQLALQLHSDTHGN